MDLGLANAATAVVGGSRGMGLAAARCFAEDGARVALIGRTPDALESAAAELTRLGSPDAVGLVADIGDAGQVDHVFAELAQRWNGELNVLVNTVGPGAPGELRRFDRRAMARIRRRRSDGDGALRSYRTSLATQG